jgi:membrane-bound lytic murein transglycosylase D
MLDHPSAAHWGWFKSLRLPATAVILVSCSHFTPSSEPIGDLVKSEPLPIAGSVEPTTDSPSEKATKFCADDRHTQSLTEMMRTELKGVRDAEKILQKYSKSLLRNHVEVKINRLDFPIVMNSRVDTWIRFYTTHGRGTFIKWLYRGQALKQPIMEILQEHGLPQELYYLAMIESGFNPTVRSAADAVGTWQFLEKTAKHYGLQVNRHIDERMDPLKSTVAAARYLTDLYGQFQDWHLAIAAYNAGPNRIKKAIKKLGNHNYWAIVNSRFIPKETKNYVAKMIATLNMAQNATAYGFHIAPTNPHFFPDHYLTLPEQAALADLASALQVPIDTIRQWNPEIKGNRTPPTKADQPYRLRVSQQVKLHVGNFLKGGKPLVKVAKGSPSNRDSSS